MVASTSCQSDVANRSDGWDEPEPGVVRQNVDLPELGQGRLNQNIYIRLGRHVGTQAERPAAGLGRQPLGSGMGLVLVPARDHDAGALSEIPAGDSTADATTATRDDGKPTLQAAGLRHRPRH